jgi:hypothetical protein
VKTTADALKRDGGRVGASWRADWRIVDTWIGPLWTARSAMWTPRSGALHRHLAMVALMHAFIALHVEALRDRRPRRGSGSGPCQFTVQIRRKPVTEGTESMALRRSQKPVRQLRRARFALRRCDTTIGEREVT